ALVTAIATHVERLARRLAQRNPATVGGSVAARSAAVACRSVLPRRPCLAGAGSGARAIFARFARRRIGPTHTAAASLIARVDRRAAVAERDDRERIV